MPINNIGRNVNQVSLTTTATLGADVELAEVDATAGNFTVTLTDFEDNAFHQIVFVLDPDDTSGNNVTISGNAGSFSTTISSDGATSAIIQTKYDGTWFVVGDVSSTDAAAANSRAVSAGLQASTADSKAISDSVNISVTSSGVTSNSINISVSGSQNTSQSILISGADSANTSQSLLVSVADSKAVSNSVVISSLSTTTNSSIASVSLNLSTTTSTANSG